MFPKTLDFLTKILNLQGGSSRAFKHEIAVR
uniref:Uncharacterized protein n=1 Tax=Nelumbo nucifera TaxID=4432 RepID=A0A822YSY2_NELNU|nr:TPA_asm: hypothetical protein HUJ06_011179 [Nelumbo nucifera]